MKSKGFYEYLKSLPHVEYSSEEAKKIFLKELDKPIKREPRILQLGPGGMKHFSKHKSKQ